MMRTKPKFSPKKVFKKEDAIGLIVAVVLIIIVCMNSRGSERLVFGFFAAAAGIITGAIIKGILTKEFKRTVVSVVLIVIISGSLLFTLNVTVGIDEIHDFFAPDHSLDFKLYGSYTIDGSIVSEEMKTERSTLISQPRRPMPENWTLKSILTENGLEFLNEVWAAAVFDEDTLVILTFGRELKEIKYKYLGYYGDGVTAKGEITFYEEYEDNAMYVYYTEGHDLYFMNYDFYIIEDGNKIVLDNARFIG